MHYSFLHWSQRVFHKLLSMPFVLLCALPTIDIRQVLVNSILNHLLKIFLLIMKAGPQVSYPFFHWTWSSQCSLWFGSFLCQVRSWYPQHPLVGAFTTKSCVSSYPCCWHTKLDIQYSLNALVTSTLMGTSMCFCTTCSLINSRGSTFSLIS